MMVLILVLSVASVYVFFRQYRKEMREKSEAAKRKTADGNGDSPNVADEKAGQ